MKRLMPRVQEARIVSFAEPLGTFAEVTLCVVNDTEPSGSDLGWM